jgi:luciferase family oxidoreductase group 1
VVELQNYFRDPQQGNPVQAIPGRGLAVPIWILGSSLYGAELAAVLGLPYAFASHFAPRALMQALDTYRQRFKPSEQLSQPYVMAGFNVFAADTDDEGHYLRTSARQSTLWLRRGQPGPLPPPDAHFESQLSPEERTMLDEQGACSAVGSAATVLEQMQTFVARTQVDELMLASQIFDHGARLRSFEIAMGVWVGVGSKERARG